MLVLDDYHLVTNRVCHDSLGFFVDHLPANVHLMVATRVDPPLPLARLRASGELTELRIVDLGFTDAEATTLLNQSMGLELTAQQTQRLCGVDRGLGGRAGPGRAVAAGPRRSPGLFIALFAQLLSLQLAEQEPEMVPVLHRRAAAWYQHAGDVEAAIDHACQCRRVRPCRRLDRPPLGRCMPQRGDGSLPSSVGSTCCLTTSSRPTRRWRGGGEVAGGVGGWSVRRPKAGDRAPAGDRRGQ